MDLSVVIPVFEESRKIRWDIEAASKFLKNNNLNGEIIVVDDGSRDNTASIAKSVKISPQIPLNVEHYDQHRGKGYAVRTGIKMTSGKYVMFSDSGCCIPYKNILPGLNMLKSGVCDIAHGSRKLHESKIQKPQNISRRICSKIFRWSMINVMKIPHELSDTQCGFKIYRGDVARKLYSRCITDGFMFDVEIILLAIKHGYRIKEFPVEWACDIDSRLSPTRNWRHIFLELITIKKVLGNQKKSLPLK